MYVSVIKDELKVTFATAEETVVVLRRTIPNVSLSFAAVIASSVTPLVLTLVKAIVTPYA